jgi:hypothetical protein
MLSTALLADSCGLVRFEEVNSICFIKEKVMLPKKKLIDQLKAINRNLESIKINQLKLMYPSEVFQRKVTCDLFIPVGKRSIKKIDN